MPVPKTRWLLAEIIEAFDTHLEELCGLGESTRRNYLAYVKKFLADKYADSIVDLENLGPIDLIAFVSEQATRYQPKTTQQIAIALRSFLRFLQFHGLCEAWLVDSVPTVPHWKQSSLPKVLTRKQIERLLGSFDLSKPIGLRDQAIALCLVELGLRASEVSHLSLKDIDWRKGTLLIRAGKARRADLLPLPKEAGRAIVTYLLKGRPSTDEDRIFVRHIHPEGAPICNNAVSKVIRRAFHRAGIDASSKGSHILRHTLATRMIQGGASLKEIADVLRHRSLDTTTIYAKVNLPMLAEVTMPFPELL